MSHLNWVVDSSFSVRVTWMLLHCLWQGCCCGILVLAGDTLFQQRPARLHYLWNWTGLFLLAVCMPVTFSLITVSDRGKNAGPIVLDEEESVVLSSEPAELSLKSGSDPAPLELPFDAAHAASASRASAQTGKSETTMGDNFDRSTIEKSESAVASADQSFRRLSLWITAIYVAGVLLALVRLVRGTWGGHQLRQSAQALHDHELLKLIETLAHRIGLRTIPTVAWCRDISVPVVVGVLRPIILLPVATVSGLSSKQLEALLLHELAHIRRFDPLLNLLQRVIEALFFFHPVVWFISRRISIEREHAADDMVLAQGWERPRYADALLRVAELSSKTTGKPFAASATMLGAAGSSPSEFKLRLLRVLEVPPPAELFPSQTAILLTLLVGAGGGIFVTSQSFHSAGFAQSSSNSGSEEPNPDRPRGKIDPGPNLTVDEASEQDGNPSRDVDQENPSNWSEPINGLRMRVVPVLSSMSEDAIDPTQRVTTFANPEDVAFAVEVENCSPETISLLDTRYGPSYGAAKGKPSSNWFAQFLFSIELCAENGELVERPDVQIVSQDSVLSGALPVSLPPGASHRFLLRPSKWLGPFAHRFEPGSYRLAVRYHGMPEKVATRIKEFSPHSETSDAWRGGVVSQRFHFDVLAPPQEQKSDESENNHQNDADFRAPLLAWGEPSNGLRTAMTLLPQKARYAHGDILEIKIHVKNVSDQPITLASPLWLSSIPVSVINSSGEAIETQGVTQLGRTLVARIRIKPSQTVVFDAGDLGLALTNGRAKSFERLARRRLVVPAGEYTLQLGCHFGNHLLLKDGNENVLAPLDGDWMGELKSGEIPLKVVNETIHCEIVDAVTGDLIPNATASFIFSKPKSNGNEEEIAANNIFGPRNAGRIPFFIPDTVVQRADREEFEVKWGAGNHPDYDNYVPADRIPLKRFFQSDSKYIQDVLGTIKLTPKNQVAALDPKVQPVIKRLPDHLNVMAIEYDRQNDELVSVSTRTDVVVRRWDVETLQLKREVKLASDRHGNRFLFSGQLTLSDDCQRVMANIDGTVDVWETATGQRIRTLMPPPEMQSRNLTCIAGDPDLSIIAGGLMPGSGFLAPDADAYAVIWGVTSGRVLRTVAHAKAAALKSVALSPDGELLATGGQTAGTCIWKVSDGELLQVVPNENSDQQHQDPKVSVAGASQITCLRFSPDAKQLAIGDLLSVKLIEVESGRLLHRLELPYRFGTSSLVFSRDGSKIARLGTDKVVPIWSTQSGKRLGEIPIASNCGSFAADGQSFAVGLSDEKSATVIWPLSPDGVPIKE